MFSRTRRLLLTAAVVACFALGVYLLWAPMLHFFAQKIVESRTLGAGKAAPDFTLNDASGKRVSLRDFKGEVVVLNFWATWCVPCKAEIPWFIEFEKTYASRGFTVLGVSMDEDGWKAINPYAAKAKINYPIVLGNEDVNRQYGGFDALPTTVVIGRDGKVAFLHEGLIARDEYEKEIRRLL
jgi:cytochrome c biogenesis protein CcmG/thiol:disulfide interchange protein DsbE